MNAVNKAVRGSGKKQEIYNGVRKISISTRKGSGTMLKRCQMCGAEMQAKDNRRKYCDGCRATRKHFFDAAAIQRFRQEARERRKAEHDRLIQLEQENAKLREMVKGGVV